MNFINPDTKEICRLFHEVKTIAVVGLSSKPDRPSFRVAKAMQDYGFRIVPVRPGGGEILGEVAYPDLASIPFKVDMVDVFRASEHVPTIVDACIAMALPCLWLQQGVVHEQAAQAAQAAGISVVMDRCMWRDYSLLCAQ